MKLTENLFEKDAYCRANEAKVVSCTPKGDNYEVVLTQTCFFPEGGGQRGDVGRIGEANVLDTQLVNDVVVHITDKPLNVGDEVQAEIDWKVRFNRMQNHSAEHIISGVAYAKYGCNNVGFHMSEKSMTVDFDRKLTADEIATIEYGANEAVFANTTIIVSYPTAEEIPNIQYRSKKNIEENLRLVTIDGVDCCACCAPHVKRTGEIGLIKIIDCYPNKNGVRLEAVAGFDALNDYSALNTDNREIMKLLSSPRDKVVEFVTKQNESSTQLTKEIQNLLKELAMAKLKLNEVGANAYSFCDNCSFDDLRHCANTVIEGDTELCALLSQTDEGQYIYVISSKGKPVAEVLKPLNEAFDGKGGGKPQYAQGKLSGSKEDIEEMLKKLLAN